MLNQALRRTSGSNVQTIVVEALLGGPLPLVQLHLPAEPGLAHAGQDPGDVAVQHQLAVVASEESERTADHPVVAECPGDVAPACPRARSNSTPTSGVIVPHTWLSSTTRRRRSAGVLDDPDLDVVAVVVAVQPSVTPAHPSPAVPS